MRVTPTYTAQIPVYMNRLPVKPTFLSVSPTQSLLDKPLVFFSTPAGLSTETHLHFSRIQAGQENYLFRQETPASAGRCMTSQAEVRQAVSVPLQQPPAYTINNTALKWIGMQHCDTFYVCWREWLAVWSGCVCIYVGLCQIWISEERRGVAQMGTCIENKSVI